MSGKAKWPALAAALGVVIASGGRADAQSLGLVAYWRLDEGSGTVITDSSGNDNAGTLLHSPGLGWQAGCPSIQFANLRSIQFNPWTNPRVIEVPDSASLDGLDTTGAFTLAMWYCPNQPQGYGIMGRTYLRFSQQDTLKLRLELDVGSVETTDPVLTHNIWQHVAVTYDRSMGAVKFYVDGTNVGGGTLVATTLLSADKWLIAGDGANYGWQDTNHCSLDDVRVYDRALTPAQVSTLAAGQLLVLGPSVTANVGVAGAAEAGAVAGTLSIDRTGDTTDPLDVAIVVTGTAARDTGSGGDFMLSVGGADLTGDTVTIPAGEAGVTVTVTPADDADPEDDETVEVAVQPRAEYTVGAPASAVVTIADDDDPTVSVAAADAQEGDAGSPGTPGSFTVSRDGRLGEDLAVTVTLGGTATASGAGQDFTLAPDVTATVTIPTGEASVTVTVTPVEDDFAEGGETVTVDLEAGAGYAVAGSPDDSATVTIVDDDVPRLTIAVSEALVYEDGSPDSTTLTITRDFPAPDVAFDLVVTGGGAGATSADYDTTPATLTALAITGADMETTVTFTAASDPDDEGDETFTFSFANCDMCTPGDPATAEVTIVDDEAASVWIEATVAEAWEDPAAPVDGVFTVCRRGGPTGNLAVVLSVSGSATPDGDYAAITSPVTIPPGSDSVEVYVTPINDDTSEPAEDVTITLQPDAAYLLGAEVEATVVIHDDDTPLVDIAPASATCTEGVPAGFTLTRTGGTLGDLVVYVAVYGDLTTAGAGDYTAPAATVTVPDGESEVALTVATTDDSEAEADEDLAVEVLADQSGADPVNYLPLDDPSPTAAVVTIIDDEPPLVSVAADVTDTDEPLEETVTLTFTRQGNPHAELPVVIVLGGSATEDTGAGGDYTVAGLTAGVVTIAAEAAEATATVTVADDFEDEPDETVEVSIGPAGAGEYAPGSPSSVTVTITDDDVPPGDFSLSAPSRDERHASLTPVFEWTDSAGADGYDLTVATDSLLADAVLTANLAGIIHPSALADGLEAGLTYYWNVAAVNVTDTVDAEAAPWQFTVASGATPDDLDGDEIPNAEETGLPDGTEELDWDTDDDGMPDGWEVEWGLDPTKPSDANRDPDGDRRTNLEEYRDGTNPLVSDLAGLASGKGCAPGTHPRAGVALAWMLFAWIVMVALAALAISARRGTSSVSETSVRPPYHRRA